jgi:hypothetical protein
MASFYSSSPFRLTLGRGFLSGVVAFGLLQGCNAARQADTNASADSVAPTTAPTAEVATTGPASVPAPGQLTFQTPAEGSDALIAAAKAKDQAKLSSLFGPALDDLISADPVQHTNDLDTFALHATEASHLEQSEDGKAIVHIGKEDWPFPIPLVKDASGEWYFDTVAGKDEILNRRIGDDELSTIAVVRAYVDAQREYASQDRMGDSVLQYAQKIKSTPGTHDGLYWPVAEEKEESPLGPLVGQAQDEGYGKKLGSGHEPYHGYFYRILTRQGPATPAGAYSYIINGRMIAGFALVAYPAQYGNTGIMTFIVNHEGKVYQKNLGPNTVNIVSQMAMYNPDHTWTMVQ